MAFLLPLLLIFKSLNFLGNHTTKHDLVIRVENVPSSKGNLLIGIYNSPQGFMDIYKTYKNITTEADAGIMLIHVSGLAPGSYAIAVFHDANENGYLDKNFLGIPKEYYGFSNNAKGNFGPPSFEACSILLDQSKEITIKLH